MKGPRKYTCRKRSSRQLAVLSLAAILLFANSIPSTAQLSTDDRPYDDKLLRLSEILGAIHYLRELCGAREGQTWRTYDLVIELMRQGKLTADGLITHRFPLSQWRQAVSTALNKRNGTIKVVFDYTLE